MEKEKNQVKHLLGKIRGQQELSLREQLLLVLRLSLPAVLAQITSIIMQYIDASMVGSLGAESSASIGLVSSTTWLFGGVCSAASIGFSVQVAQLIGAGKMKEAGSVLQQSLLCAVIFSGILLTIGMVISGPLPGWLHADISIRADAVSYFRIYVLSIPAIQLNRLAGNMLQCSGNMRLPSMLNVAMCFLDVIFNSMLIFPSRTVTIFGKAVLLPGAGLGVIGAAFGTALSELVIAVCMMYFLCFRDKHLHLVRGNSFLIKRQYLIRAVRIAAPIAAEHIFMCGAMIATTRIVAPLGTIAIVANSFAITAESLCYMPGYGIADAATTLVGQSLGAGRKELVRKFARMTVWLGIAVMTVTGAVMFVAAPVMMELLTPDIRIQELGAYVLRIEAFAEPMFAASIVASGALRGAGDTLIPSLMNFFSIWCVRLFLAVILVKPYGLTGVWVAMCVELCFRGLIFLIRLYREKWIKKQEGRKREL